MTNPIKNAVSFLSDSLKRAKIEGEILALANKLLVKPDSCLDFEGINFADPTPESATLLLILQSITKKHKKFSLVNFKGGVALVRTEDVEKLAADVRDINEKSNFIITGGSEKAANLADNVAVPTGTIKED